MNIDTKTLIELFGYLGSAIVLVSFLMTSVFKLRIVNTIGSVIFMTYALIIHSYPTAIMNFCLVLINLRFLWKMRHTSHHYDLVSVKPDDKYLAYLVDRQSADIETYFPGVHPMEILNEKPNRCYIVTCQGDPVGIILAQEEDGVLDLKVDYSFPEYRDFSIGLFLAKTLKDQGLEKLVYKGPTEYHIAYLNKVGFVQQDGRYVKEL